MTLVDNLLDAIETEVKLSNKEEVRGELQEALKENRFRIIRNDSDEEIGFFTYWEQVKDNKLHIFINNLFIPKEHRREYNLCKLRSWFREMYPRASVFYWKSRRRNKWIYVK